MIYSYVAGRQLRLVRNPYFREWSNAARPGGYVDRIVFRLGVDPDLAVTAIERGQADYGTYDFPLAPPGNRLHELLTRYPAQVRVNPLPQVHYFIMNTRVAPFDDIRVRRALNYAVDRNVLIELNGGPDAAEPTCQAPPGIPGHEGYCPYTVNASATGAYTGPDLVKARRLGYRAAARPVAGERYNTSHPTPDTALRSVWAGRSPTTPRRRTSSRPG